MPGSEIVVKSRSVKRNAKNARGLGRDPFPKSRASYFRFARFNTSALYYLRAWHRLASRARERNPLEKLGGRIVRLQMCSFIFPINHITTWTRRRISEVLLIIFLLRAAFGYSGVGM